MPHKVYKLEKPNLSKIGEDRVIELIMKNKELAYLANKANSPEYLYWDKVKYIEVPKGIKQEELWAVIKFFRKGLLQSKTPIRSVEGNYFTWNGFLPDLKEFFHEIDMKLGGSLIQSINPDEEEKFRFISRGVMEESIASSQLEGAATSRKIAKQLLREGRKPKTIAEKMINNNYITMLMIEEQLKYSKLTMEMMLQMHESLMKGTVDDNDVGRIRNDKDNIIVAEDNIIYHVPPKETFVRKELKSLFDYANNSTKDRSFIHPVIKAITLHFWIGYLHPFTDGNGRLARAIFYWYLLRNEYWAFSYLPLSMVIKRAPSQYKKAYIYSEQDDYDLTYFIDYNVRKIIITKNEFQQYVKDKRTENKRMARLSKSKYNFNDRQIQLLRYYFKNYGEGTSIKTHTNIYRVSRLTAIKDLKELESNEFIYSKRTGRSISYFPTEKVKTLFSK